MYLLPICILKLSVLQKLVQITRKNNKHINERQQVIALLKLFDLEMNKIMCWWIQIELKYKS